MTRPLPSSVQEHAPIAAASNGSNKCPLMFLLGELFDETTNAFFDPLTNTHRTVNFPELEAQTDCLASNYGWLLLISRTNRSLFFFNPINRKRIHIPYRSSVFNAVAFSAPPTSPACTLVAYKKFSFDVLLVGQDKVWTRYPFTVSSLVESHIDIKHLVFCNETLYFVDFDGKVGTINIINNGDWKLLAHKKNFQRIPISYLFEFKGELYCVKKNRYGYIGRICRLKMDNGEANWEEVSDIGEDVTVFLGPYGSCAMTGLSDKLKKKILVADENPESKHIMYDFGNYKQGVVTDLTPFTCWFAPVWIHRSN